MMLLQCSFFISVKYRRKSLKDLDKRYGDRWCGDNPGWAPSVKSTQLHSTRKERGRGGRGRGRRGEGERIEYMQSWPR